MVKQMMVAFFMRSEELLSTLKYLGVEVPPHCPALMEFEGIRPVCPYLHRTLEGAMEGY